ncbi:ABC transporter ATP-binding protein [Haloarcula sp. CBA1129]|uniref:ABC transporter ATP-binding protein n=1 Tax=Haloarcula sp. CBA1129 TaxID=1853684 RepID=UPI001CDA198B|nr:ABC transporter ATP-binding protein [Haloarcula sp. CBA1129]
MAASSLYGCNRDRRTHQTYSDHLAVDGLSLTVDCGEAVGFLGPNGAGKSTTSTCCWTTSAPPRGPSGCSATTHRLRRERSTNGSASSLTVTPLYDRLTGREHLRLAARLKGASVDIAAVCDRVGLDAADADRPAGAYSKGMGQRLALAMATVGDPDLLILDEPTAGLDPHGVARLQDLLAAELERGTTVFFSSHVLDHVESTCDRIAILDEGQMVAVDTVDGLRAAVGSATLTLQELFSVYTDSEDRGPVAAGGAD